MVKLPFAVARGNNCNQRSFSPLAQLTLLQSVFPFKKYKTTALICQGCGAINCLGGNAGVRGNAVCPDIRYLFSVMIQQNV
jgi:hypothetical protein